MHALFFSTFWAPVVNLASEPRWGRNLETAGEDPYLSGAYAVAFVRAFQVPTTAYKPALEHAGFACCTACCTAKETRILI